MLQKVTMIMQLLSLMLLTDGPRCSADVGNFFLSLQQCDTWLHSPTSRNATAIQTKAQTNGLKTIK